MQASAQVLEAAFFQLGLQLGRQLAKRAATAEEARAPAAAENSSERQAAPLSTNKILPGLSGRRRRPGEPPPRCGRAGCERPSRTRGYCQTHYVQWLKAGEIRRAG